MSFGTIMVGGFVAGILLGTLLEKVGVITVAGKSAETEALAASVMDDLLNQQFMDDMNRIQEMQNQQFMDDMNRMQEMQNLQNQQFIDDCNRLQNQQFMDDCNRLQNQQFMDNMNIFSTNSVTPFEMGGFGCGGMF